MDYNKIMSYAIALIFAWLFVALNSNIEFTRSKKRPFFYVFSVYLSMICSFTGLVLTLKNPSLALAFSPYILASTALVFTAVNAYYVQENNITNPKGWGELKVKVYRNLTVSLVIVFSVFLTMGVKNEYFHAKKENTVSNKLDTLSKKLTENKETTEKGFEKQSLKADTVKKDLAETRKALLNPQNSVNEPNKKNVIIKKLDNIQKKATSTKEDTQDIRQKVGKTPDKPKETKQRKKFLGIF